MSGAPATVSADAAAKAAGLEGYTDVPDLPVEAPAAPPPAANNVAESIKDLTLAGEGLAPLTQVLKRVSRGRLGADRAQALFEAAHSTVGICEGRFGVHLEMQAILELIETCECFVEQLEGEMTRYLEEKIYVKGQFRRQYIRLMINTSLAVSNLDKIDRLAKEISDRKPGLLPRYALLFLVRCPHFSILINQMKHVHI